MHSRSQVGWAQCFQCGKLLKQLIWTRVILGKLLDWWNPHQDWVKVKAILDTNQYETGVELSKKDMDQLLLRRHKTHPDWNYTLLPRPLG